MNAKPSPLSTRHFSVHTYSSSEGSVVHCSGRLTQDVTHILKAEVKSLVPHNKRIVLDLTDLAFIDSAGLGTIVGLYVSGKTAGCTLELVNLSKRVRELLGMTNVLSVFESCGRYLTRLP